ncbi:hypothetical protein Hanom_Chr00s000002g01599701 [Helianthus anomalus]
MRTTPKSKKQVGQFIAYNILDQFIQNDISISISNIYLFSLNGKFGSLTDHWSIIVPPAEPPDHIHLH